jgi:hypothetical protein
MPRDNTNGDVVTYHRQKEPSTESKIFIELLSCNVFVLLY